jgi:hypothetical protein
MNEQEWMEIRGILETSKISNIKKVALWLALDCPVSPPSAYKQELIKTYQRHYGNTVLIETGTYLGDMVSAMADSFDEIHSVELSKDLHDKAKDRFRKNKNIKLYQGDSGEVLAKILSRLSKPAIFWLDAHYSAGITAKGKLNTPILEEVELILSHKIKNHVVLVDDSRMFTGEEDYPAVKDLRKKVVSVLPRVSFVDRHDVIRIQPDDSDIDI